MKKLLFVTLAFCGLAFAGSPAKAAECADSGDANLLSWDVDMGSVPVYVMEILKLDEKNCVNATIDPITETKTIVNRFKDETGIDGTVTFEGPASLMKDIEAGRLTADNPVLLSSFAGSLFRIVGTVPLSELVSYGDDVKIVATGRCSDMDDHEGGLKYRDITDPAKETYVEAPSANTVEKLRMFRREIGASWPKETRIICGEGFAAGNRPKIDGPVIWIEAAGGTGKRLEGLLNGTFAATSLWLEKYYSVKDQKQLYVYEREPGANRLLSMGLYVMPKKLAEKKETYCRLNQALAETTALLLAGEASIDEKGDVTFDDAAASAFAQFQKVLELESNNPLSGTLTIIAKDMTDPKAEEKAAAATQKLRQQIFVEARNTLWKADLKPTKEDVDLMFDWFDFRVDKELFLSDPCA